MKIVIRVFRLILGDNRKLQCKLIARTFCGFGPRMCIVRCAMGGRGAWLVDACLLPCLPSLLSTPTPSPSFSSLPHLFHHCAQCPGSTTPALDPMRTGNGVCHVGSVCVLELLSRWKLRLENLSPPSDKGTHRLEEPLVVDCVLSGLSQSLPLSLSVFICVCH